MTPDTKEQRQLESLLKQEEIDITITRLDLNVILNVMDRALQEDDRRKEKDKVLDKPVVLKTFRKLESYE